MYCVYLSLGTSLLVSLDFNEAKSKDPGACRPRFESCLSQLVMGPWASYIASQCFSFMIHEDGERNGTDPLGSF